jgi:hypothetical protein
MRIAFIGFPIRQMDCNVGDEIAPGKILANEINHKHFLLFECKLARQGELDFASKSRIPPPLDLLDSVPQAVTITHPFWRMRRHEDGGPNNTF